MVMFTRMNTCLRSLFTYFDLVLHPAAGWADEKHTRKRKTQKNVSAVKPSPECFNVRGIAKAQDKLRRNPAP
jgi:hypothetical protein